MSLLTLVQLWLLCAT